MIRLVRVALLAAVLAAACDEAILGPSPTTCPKGLIEGNLEPLGFADGIGIAVGPTHTLIAWPPPYATRAVGGRLSVVDGSGRVIASVGDRVRVPGGADQYGWSACGDPIVQVLQPA